MKSTVYREVTHTDQYLNFASQQPTHQKLGVVRPLMNEEMKHMRQRKREVKDHQ